jgi:hypothetical protein
VRFSTTRPTLGKSECVYCPEGELLLSKLPRQIGFG